MKTRKKGIKFLLNWIIKWKKNIRVELGYFIFIQKFSKILSYLQVTTKKTETFINFKACSVILTKKLCYILQCLIIREATKWFWKKRLFRIIFNFCKKNLREKNYRFSLKRLLHVRGKSCQNNVRMKNSYKKFVRKMLMKLTVGSKF